MSRKFFIHTGKNAQQGAIMAEGKLVEYNTEDNIEKSVVGNIYKGKVINVLKGMQAAFVDIGLEKNAYLFVGDSMVDDNELTMQANLSGSYKLEVEPGDDIMVQVVKAETGTKGARVTSNISIAGRDLVFMPYVNYVGVSRKIEDENLRNKLISIVDEVRPKSSGYIIRTAANSASKKDLIDEAKSLVKIWEGILNRYQNTRVTEVVYKEGELVERLIRDVYTPDVEEIVVDDKQTYENVKNLMDLFIRHYKTKISYFDNPERDMFSDYGVTQQISRIINPKVTLSNGAYLIIEKTEALTVIDVNTGKYVGEKNLEETVFQTNIVAAKEIASQLKLRNIGGIIIIDFIDMEKENNRKKVVEVLKEELKKDRLRTIVVGMTGLGLVEVTRKKSRKDMIDKLTQTCNHCEGKGYIKSFDVIVSQLKSRIIDAFYGTNNSGVLIETSPELCDHLFKTHCFARECETIWLNKRIYVVSIPEFKTEYFYVTNLVGAVYDLPMDARLLY